MAVATTGDSMSTLREFDKAQELSNPIAHPSVHTQPISSTPETKSQTLGALQSVLVFVLANISVSSPQNSLVFIIRIHTYCIKMSN